MLLEQPHAFDDNSTSTATDPVRRDEWVDDVQVIFGLAREWHRFVIIRAHDAFDLKHHHASSVEVKTACGLSIGSSYYSTRDPSYAGALCRRGCFTAYELKLADEQRAADERARPRPLVTDEQMRISREGHEEQVRKLKTDRMKRIVAVISDGDDKEKK